MTFYLIATFFLYAGHFDQRTTTGNPFDQRGLVPKNSEVRLYGKVSSGCILGAQPLNFKSTNYIALGKKRNAYWGHPELIKKIDKWAKWTKYNLNRKFKVADVSLPYGGPATPRHGTHQQGIDVDIPLALEPVHRLPIDVNRFSSPEIGVHKAVLTDLSDEGIAKYVLDTRVSAYWDDRIYRLVKHVANDPDVSRIIVNPSIRNRICQIAGVQRRADRVRTQQENLPANSVPRDLRWIRKLRFFGGHTYHMHIRVHACIGQPGCKRKLARPYSGTDWGLGCNLDRGPNQYWFGDYVYYFDPNDGPHSTDSYLKQRALQAECRKNPALCNSSPLAAESDLKKTDPVLTTGEDKSCYNIKVQRGKKQLFEIKKCVPKICGEIISAH